MGAQQPDGPDGANWMGDAPGVPAPVPARDTGWDLPALDQRPLPPVAYRPSGRGPRPGSSLTMRMRTVQPPARYPRRLKAIATSST